jgi:glutaredoxin 3
MSQPTTVKVYTIPNCPFCTNAKNLLADQKIDFEEIHIDRSDEARRAELSKLSGMKTFPQIFFGKKVIGGFTDLKQLHDTVGLKSALNAV